MVWGSYLWSMAMCAFHKHLAQPGAKVWPGTFDRDQCSCWSTWEGYSGIRTSAPGIHLGMQYQCTMTYWIDCLCRISYRPFVIIAVLASCRSAIVDSLVQSGYFPARFHNLHLRTKQMGQAKFDFTPSIDATRDLSSYESQLAVS